MRPWPLLLLALAAAGCATQRPLTWARTDGKVFTADQFNLERTICRGEMQKANLAGFPAEGVGSAIRRGNAVGDVFVGCMAQRGYIQVPVD